MINLDVSGFTDTTLTAWRLGFARLTRDADPGPWRDFCHALAAGLDEELVERAGTLDAIAADVGGIGTLVESGEDLIPPGWDLE